MAQEITGYPSVDKPWLKYYSEEAATFELPKHSMYEHIYECNKDHPDEIALVYFEKKITFKQLFDNIDRVARAFVSIGVKEGDVVTLILLNHPEMVYCLYALNKIGAVASVFNVSSSAEEIEHFLTECKSDYLVTLDIFFDKAYKAAKARDIKVLVTIPLFYSHDIIHQFGYRMKVRPPKVKDAFIISWRDFLRRGSGQSIPRVSRKSSECSIIGHTGGTTGVPKGFLLSSDALNAIAAQYVFAFEHVRQDSFLDLIAPFAIYGMVGSLHMPLSLGMKVILIPKVNPETVDELIIKYRPNYIVSIPTYWTSIIDSKKITDLSFLKLAAAGGSGFSYGQIIRLNEIFRKYHANTELLMGYGMSEVSSIACTQKNGNAAPHSVGFPLPKNIVAAFDIDTTEELPYNAVGELCINTPSIMLGYLDNPEETQAAIRTHKDGGIWMHSGDLGYVDENGNVFIQGRLRRIYLTSFQGAPSKIFPDRIEQTLMKNPALHECGVVCITSMECMYKPVAFCVMNDNKGENQSIIEQELLEQCRKELPAFAVPVSFIFMDELPRSAHGKVDYRALEEEAKTLIT